MGFVTLSLAPANPLIPRKGLFEPSLLTLIGLFAQSPDPATKFKPGCRNRFELITCVRALRISWTFSFSSEKRNSPRKKSTFARGSVRRGPIMLIIAKRVLIEGVIAIISASCAEQNK
jgi:hypothetical protein